MSHLYDDVKVSLRLLGKAKGFALYEHEHLRHCQLRTIPASAGRQRFGHSGNGRPHAERTRF